MTISEEEYQELVSDNITLRHGLKEAIEENKRLNEKYKSLLNKYGETTLELLRIVETP